jgi:hypothetical protein
LQVEPITDREDVVAMARFSDSRTKGSQWVLRMLLAHRYVQCCCCQFFCIEDAV